MELSSRLHTMLSRGATAAALLTCLAVVLDVGGASKVGGGERAQTQAEAVRTFTSAPLASSEREKNTGPSLLQPLMPVMDLSVFEVFEPQPPSAPEAGGGLPASSTQPAIVGIWAPDMSSCSLRDFRQGLLPTIINTDGAWAGETFCTFKNQKQTDTGWRVVATCANSTEQWTTQVRLTVKGARLTWASKRGTQTYTRCTPDLRMADVQ